MSACIPAKGWREYNLQGQPNFTFNIMCRITAGYSMLVCGHCLIFVMLQQLHCWIFYNGSKYWGQHLDYCLVFSSTTCCDDIMTQTRCVGYRPISLSTTGDRASGELKLAPVYTVYRLTFFPYIFYIHQNVQTTCEVNHLRV